MFKLVTSVIQISDFSCLSKFHFSVFMRWTVSLFICVLFCFEKSHDQISYLSTLMTHLYTLVVHIILLQQQLLLSRGSLFHQLPSILWTICFSISNGLPAQSFLSSFDFSHQAHILASFLYILVERQCCCSCIKFFFSLCP